MPDDFIPPDASGSFFIMTDKSLPKLNMPAARLRFRLEGEMMKVFDPLRGKYVALTPEEFVRQHFTAWLISNFGYPASLMANETGLELNGTRRRCDTVVFTPEGSPLLIVEYKAPSVEITQGVFDQIVRYNMCLHAQYLIVSNGLRHFCCAIDYEHDTYQFLPRIPAYVRPDADKK